jgi:chemotaxis protein CheD
MVSGLSDIGQSNIDFTLDFLTKESIICEGHSLGGSSARHIKFWPASGRVMQKIAKDASVQPLDLRPVSEVSGNGLELF